MSQSIKFKRSPVFRANKLAYLEGWPIICNEGGSRSGKSYSIIQLLILIAAYYKPGIRISIVSHSLPHIKKGAYRDFQTIMKGWQLWDDEEFSYTDFVYTFSNGSYVELIGLEDESKARGPGRDILFINEANLVKKGLFDQLAMRTTGQIFLDWNPADFNSWVYEIADDPKNKKIHSTYRNNLSNLSANQVAIIEGYKDLPDPFMWEVYGSGKRGASEEIIFRGWKTYSETPKGDVFYGLDFGFVHPAAVVKVTLHEGAAYIEEIIYQSGLTMSDLAGKVLNLQLGFTPLYCDAAEPKSIEELYRYGINVHKADKDDVWATIMKMKSMPLFIHENSKNLIREMQGYKWKKDKNDRLLEEPVKENDDLIDAARYAIFTHTTKPSWEVFTV